MRVQQFVPTLCAILLALWWLSPCPARSTTPDALALAQMCWLEASYNKADCTAIGYVLKRKAARQGRSFFELTRSYGAIRSGSERAVLALHLPDGNEPSWNAAFNRRWAELRVHARAVVEGRVRRPCIADHWGSPSTLLPDPDRITKAVSEGRWRVVRCGDTANIFVRELKLKRLSAAAASGKIGVSP